MMATHTLDYYFDGKVTQDEYTQPLQVEGLGAARVLWTGVFESQTFRFLGVPSDLAHSRTQITVTDIDNRQYTFTPVSSFTDSSTGTATFAKETVRVTRERISIHLWNLTVTRVGGKIVRNGVKYYDGPTWMDDYNV